MAASRLERIGSIYTRVRGLLRSGAMKPEDKPIWYDVYEAFPPKIEPVFGRKDPDIPIRNILYQEDIIRAKFYKHFGSPGLISLRNNRSITPCQRFLDKYMEMKKDYSNEDELFSAAVRAFEADQALAKENISTPDSTSASPSSFSSMFKSAVETKKDPSKFNAEELLKDDKK